MTKMDDYIGRGWVTTEQALGAGADVAGEPAAKVLGRVQVNVEIIAELLDTDDLHGVDHDELANVVGRALALCAAWRESLAVAS